MCDFRRCSSNTEPGNPVRKLPDVFNRIVFEPAGQPIQCLVCQLLRNGRAAPIEEPHQCEVKVLVFACRLLGIGSESIEKPRESCLCD